MTEVWARGIPPLRKERARMGHPAPRGGLAHPFRNQDYLLGPPFRTNRGKGGATASVIPSARKEISAVGGWPPFDDSQNGVAPSFPRFLREGGPSRGLESAINACQASPLSESRLPALHHLQLLSADEAARV